MGGCSELELCARAVVGATLEARPFACDCEVVMALDTTSHHATEVQKLNQPIIWSNVIGILLFHLLAVYGLLTLPLLQIRWQTYLWGYFLYLAGGFGVAGGVHRLWTHRTYKAKWPLRIILLVCFSISGQNSVFDWVRDHRIHHKFSETDADPHNANRGFFFSHVGWLMQRKHPEVLRRGRQVDMSDVLADPLVRFHNKYFSLLKMLFCFFVPVVVPPLLWSEGWYNSAMGVGILRYVLLLNAAWSVNSLAHIWGGKPYDREISPTENVLVTWLTAGEGWHNYHHAIPWDYKAAELGPSTVNWTTYLIEMFSRIGWAYDLKTPSPDLIRRLVERRGDGTHYKWGAGIMGTAGITKQIDDEFQKWGAARELAEESQ
ncbi:acyl-CoA Delta(11) desaturase-like isoform X2 [Zootermopsis nevadensis]|uniref:acyl-CoA Delta(11) desaturase-like isoform X2 n=1 Tax=Zootermopsis nevadensis TaxID=136037 RepID=UPI000B8EB9F6|nr:acyl-CoA Delta(11) desaturase-like isoform X2 [Zootermopsis nevadensis]